MRVYIKGYGSIGKRHHKILQQLHPGIAVDIYDPILGHSDQPIGNYDVALVCTPTESHIKDAIEIREKCDLLFVEKPLSTSLLEIEKNHNLLKDRKVHVGCNIRYTRAVKKLKDLSEEARVINVTSMSNLLKWRDDPEKKAYSFHKHLGGGALMDFIHEPDYVYSVFGLPIVSQTLQGRLHRNVTVDSNDTCVMNWQYVNKFVTFTLSYGSRDYIRKYDVLKDDGSLESVSIDRSDIEESYVRQWKDILSSGPKNSYDDCLQLYGKILEGGC